MNLAVLRVAMARWMAIAVMVVLGAMVPQTASAQHIATLCPPQTATVAAGGAVTIEITTCNSDIGLVGIGPAMRLGRDRI